MSDAAPPIRLLSLVEPPVEDLIAKAEGSKFTLVTAAAARAREITEYFNGMGAGHGSIIPPQVRSASNKSLTVAFEEIAQGRLLVRHLTDDERIARDTAPVPEPISELEAFTEQLRAG